MLFAADNLMVDSGSLIILISNPAARSSSREKLEQAVRYMNNRGFETELLFTEARGHAEALAKEAVKKKPFRIIAAGGDGTINEVINGMIMSEVPLSVLPLGTTNVLARELSIPISVEGAIDRALIGETRRVSLGRINAHYSGESVSRCFCLMAGIGFDAKAVYDMKSSIKKISGKGAYFLSGINNLIHYSPNELCFTVDGKEHSGYAAIIGKSSRYGGDFRITPDADLRDPHLFICIFKGKKRADILRYAFGVVRSNHLQYKDVHYQKASCISIVGDAHIQIDGDYLGKNPSEVTVLKDSLKLVW